jgi:proton glutamate symport protein
MGFLHRLSFSQQLLVGLFGGLLTGLFFGELAEPLAILGSIFVRLLQMAVLPYVLFSLVGSVGKLSSGNVRGLLKVGGSLLLGSWALALAFVALNPLAFPEWESASFFSDALVAEDRSLDFIALYLPTNPFHALANNIVPSVVVFSLAVGGALIHVPNKERMTDVLDVATSALSRVTSSVARFMPIAIFAVTASAAGTMSLDDLSRLQVYFVLYLFACAVLTFGVLPLVLSMWTPLK